MPILFYHRLLLTSSPSLLTVSLYHPRTCMRPPSFVWLTAVATAVFYYHCTATFTYYSNFPFPLLFSSIPIVSSVQQPAWYARAPPLLRRRRRAGVGGISGARCRRRVAFVPYAGTREGDNPSTRFLDLLILVQFCRYYPHVIPSPPCAHTALPSTVTFGVAQRYVFCLTAFPHFALSHGVKIRRVPSHAPLRVATIPHPTAHYRCPLYVFD